MERETNLDELQEFFTDNFIAFLNDENTPIESSLTSEGLEPAQKDDQYRTDSAYADSIDARLDSLLRQSEGEELRELEPADRPTKRIKLEASSKRVFAQPKSAEEVKKANLSAIPVKTMHSSICLLC